MSDVCGDNRFEIIAKAKADILESTNIGNSPDEMKVLDSFLFRCWQMGWLDKYDDTKEAEPVVHGEWEHLGGDEWCCTVCENVITTEGSWEKPTQKFCDECGAKMKGANDE